MYAECRLTSLSESRYKGNFKTPPVLCLQAKNTFRLSVSHGSFSEVVQKVPHTNILSCVFFLFELKNQQNQIVST